MASKTNRQIRKEEAVFELPVSNVLANVNSDTFNCPGSMLRVIVDTDQTLAFGMRQEEAAYFARSPAFRTRVPDASWGPSKWATGMRRMLLRRGSRQKRTTSRSK